MKRNETFVKKSVGEKTLLIPTGSSVKHMHGLITLNATGSLIWEMLASDISKEEIVLRLKEIYGDKQKNLVQDVSTFIDQLLQMHLVHDV